MKLRIDLHLTNKDYRLFYNGILSFLNQEISLAYDNALSFYNDIKIKELNFAEIQENFMGFCSTKKLSEYQVTFIKRSIFSGTSQKVRKPKKLHFAKLTNRSTGIDTGIFQISFDKSVNFVAVDSIEFESLDDFIREQSFLSEFINMVNTIDWPTKPGPSRPLRGCVMTSISKQKHEIFYKAGPNPLLSKEAVDTTLSEPGALTSAINKNISISLISKETHTQPIHSVEGIEEF